MITVLLSELKVTLKSTYIQEERQHVLSVLYVLYVIRNMESSIPIIIRIHL